MLSFEISNGIWASLAAAFVSTTGLASMAFLGDWGRRRSSLFSSFAVGILTAAVIFHLIPEAIATDATAWRAMAASFGLLAMISLVLRFVIGGRGGNRGDGSAGTLAFGLASVVALGFHSYIDGFVYESSFHGDAYTGGIAAVGLLLHEFPEGIIAYFLMREAGLRGAAALMAAFVLSSLTTVLGAVTAAIVLADFAAVPLGQLLGIASGALTYIVAFHLAPHGATAPRPAGYLAGSLGIIVATLAEIFRHAGHAH